MRERGRERAKVRERGDGENTDGLRILAKVAFYPTASLFFGENYFETQKTKRTRKKKV